MKINCKGESTELNKLFHDFLNELKETAISEEDQDLFLNNFVEAVHNAVEHGNQNDKEKTIAIETNISPNFCYVSIKDQGSGFIPQFPDLKNISGPRGRGLGIIQHNTDYLSLNTKGNQIVFWKSYQKEQTMRYELENSSMDIEELGGGAILITNFCLSPSGLLHHALSELFQEKVTEETKLILLDATGIRIFSSLGWGVIANYLNQSETHRIILFNISPAIAKMGQILGFGDGGVYPNITLMPKMESQTVGSF